MCCRSAVSAARSPPATQLRPSSRLPYSRRPTGAGHCHIAIPANGSNHIDTVPAKAAQRCCQPSALLPLPACRRYSWSAQRTMAVAQQLYEGPPGTSEGLITYMRTDGYYIAEDALTAIRHHIHSRCGSWWHDSLQPCTSCAHAHLDHVMCACPPGPCSLLACHCRRSGGTPHARLALQC